MLCINHTTTTASARCTGCAEPYCGNCLVDLAGEKFCDRCKMMGVKQAPRVEQKMMLCTEAKTAMVASLVGVFIFSFILGPVAVFTGFKARRLIKGDPTLTGSGLAAAGIVIGVVVSFMAIINLTHRG